MHLWKALEWYSKGSCEYNCGETYESLEWSEKNRLRKPTKEKLEKAWEEYLVFQNENAYKELRARLYPSIPDQLDMIYKYGLEAWSNKIEDIKRACPSPNGKNTREFINPVKSMAKEIENLKEQVVSQEASIKTQQASMQNQLNEVNSAILAIKGFMMEIPNITKQIQELKESVNNNFTSK